MTESRPTRGDGRVQFLTPEGLHRNPAFSNVAVVKGLAHPDFLVEIEAIAVVPA